MCKIIPFKKEKEESLSETFKKIDKREDRLQCYSNLLYRLIAQAHTMDKEQCLLKDWFDLKNKIRKVEKRIREVKNEQNK